jgi:hypothetical protein
MNSYTEGEEAPRCLHATVPFREEMASEQQLSAPHEGLEVRGRTTGRNVGGSIRMIEVVLASPFALPAPLRAGLLSLLCDLKTSELLGKLYKVGCVTVWGAFLRFPRFSKSGSESEPEARKNKMAS